MKRLTLTNITLGLCGLLLAAFAIFMVDRGSQMAWPSITNNRPSGFMAFAELLRRDGYQVVLERSGAPKLGKDDLAVTPNFVQVQSQWEAWMEEEDDEPTSRVDDVGDKDQPLEAALKKHVKDGGNLLYIPVPLWFDDQSKKVVKEQEIRSGDNSVIAKASYGDTGRYTEDRPEWSQGDTEAVVWQTAAQQPLTSVATFGSSRVGIVSDGLMATNRHLDENDNARILLALVRQTAKPGGRVVFVESVFGNVEAPGLFAAIGSWANAARWQAIFLLAVIVFTLGRRFGLPEVEHPVERGARDMLVAVSGTLRANRREALALNTIASEAVERSRRILRLPPSATEKEILDRVPAELALAIRNVRLRDVTSKPLSPIDHACLIQGELKGFEQDSRDRSRQPIIGA